MGPVELFAESVRVYSCEENPVYPRRAIAKTAVEVQHDTFLEWNISENRPHSQNRPRNLEIPPLAYVIL
eukprot:4170282-Amphidinium_carterae.1